MKKLMAMIACACLAVAAGALLTGCKDKSATSGSNMNMEKMADQTEKTADTMAEDATQMAEKAAEQTICPIMGGAINKECYTEYKGKKVYFCCPDCKEAFAKDPEKYIKDLPQFN